MITESNRSLWLLNLKVSLFMLSIARLLRRSPVHLQRRLYNSDNAKNVQQTLFEAHDSPPSANESGYAQAKATNPLRSDLDLYHVLIPRYRLHCHSSRNNTITTLTHPNGSTVAWFSGGSCDFKKSQRASYEAGYQCAVRMFERIEFIAKAQAMYIDLFLKGFGQGREALQKALLSAEGENVRNLIYTVTDRTPLKIGGTRAKKARRL
jgi:small subunit ribosomal protein S11